MNYNKVGSKWLGIYAPHILLGRDKSKKKKKNLFQEYASASWQALPKNSRWGCNQLFTGTEWKGQAPKGIGTTASADWQLFQES